MEQITNTIVSRLCDGPVELSIDQLALVAGGLPKGTWSETSSLPKGTWQEETSSLPKGTWEA